MSKTAGVEVVELHCICWMLSTFRKQESNQNEKKESIGAGRNRSIFLILGVSQEFQSKNKLQTPERKPQRMGNMKKNQRRWVSKAELSTQMFSH